jgi:type IV pilus assembly protein PilV
MKVRNEKGMSLTELMISAAVLGVGVMGMAAMQGMSFTKNVDAHDLSIITNVTSDMMERIQNNRRYAWAYHNLQTAGPGNCLAGGMPAPYPAVPNFGGETLNDKTVELQTRIGRTVQGDCMQWKALVDATGLVNVQGNVQVVPVLPASKGSGAVQVAVQIQWNDRGANSGQRPRAIMFRTQIDPE